MNVIVYDLVGDIYYGVVINKKIFLRNKCFLFMEWIVILNNIWSKVKDFLIFVIVIEVFFMFVLEIVVKDFYDVLMLLVFIVFMWKRRFVVSNDMWGCKY